MSQSHHKSTLDLNAANTRNTETSDSFIPYNPEIYIDTTLERIHSKYGYHIIHLTDITKVDEYLKTHPNETPVAFLLGAPGLVDQGHYSPIFFERKNDKEYFLQIDSIGDVAYILPDSKNSAIQRSFYYSPFIRQVHESGCVEDAIKILIKCFQEKDMFAFVNSNSKKDNTITMRVTEDDDNRYAELYKKYDLRNNPHLKLPEDEQQFLRAYRKRNAYNKLADAFKKRNTDVITDVHELTSLPARFLVNIEHKRTLNHFLKNEPEKFNELYKAGETVGQHIMRKGEIYKSKNASNHDDTNPTNTLSEYKGQDFLQRRSKWEMKSRKYQIKKNNPNLSEHETNEMIKRQLAFEKSEEIKAIFATFQNSSSIPQLNCNELLALDVDMSNLVNSNGYNPLHAIAYMDIPSIQFFLNHGVDINKKDFHGRTPFHNLDWKFETSDAKLKFIIDNGAKPEIKDNAGNNALFYAAELGTAEQIKIILEKFSNLITTTNNAGWTPLMSAIDSAANTYSNENSFSVIKTLIEAGVDLNAISTQPTGEYPAGITAYDIAMKCNEALQKLILSYPQFSDNNKQHILEEKSAASIFMSQDEENMAMNILTSMGDDNIPQQKNDASILMSEDEENMAMSNLKSMEGNDNIPEHKNDTLLFMSQEEENMAMNTLKSMEGSDNIPEHKSDTSLFISQEEENMAMNILKSMEGNDNAPEQENNASIVISQDEENIALNILRSTSTDDFLKIDRLEETDIKIQNQQGNVSSSASIIKQLGIKTPANLMQVTSDLKPQEKNNQAKKNAELLQPKPIQSNDVEPQLNSHKTSYFKK